MRGLRSEHLQKDSAANSVDPHLETKGEGLFCPAQLSKEESSYSLDLVIISGSGDYMRKDNSKA